jgi:hypothetical protein
MRSVVAFAVFTILLVATGSGASIKGSASTPVGNPCVLGQSNKICLAIKYVVYDDPHSNPVATRKIAADNLRVMNKIYGQCDIAFQIEEFDEVVPSQYGLRFHTANTGELDSIRSAFADASRLLVVTTGTWNRSGTLGSTSANAWTSMPESAPYGSIIEASVADYSNIYAHEIGHYLNLEHASDQSNLMSPIIYNSSTAFTHSQCEAMRSTATSVWNQMIRA